MKQHSVAVIKDIYTAFERGDLPGVFGAMADDIEWHEAEGMPYGGVYHGVETVARYVLGPIIEDIPDFEVRPTEFIVSGETVAVVARYTGTGKVTGRQLDLNVVHVWDVHAGKASRFRQFADTATFLQVVPHR